MGHTGTTMTLKKEMFEKRLENVQLLWTDSAGVIIKSAYRNSHLRREDS